MGQKKPRTVEEWLNQVKTCWERIPPYKVDSQKLKHLAVLCDGNRRAAIAKGFENPFEGHRAGREVLKGIAEATRHWGIKTVTFWAFSTENWKRKDGTVPFLMKFSLETLKEVDLEELQEKGVRFRHLGRKDRINQALRRGLERLEEETAGNTRFNLNLTFDYGGENELIRAIQKIIADGIPPKRINVRLISSYLDTVGLPNPDLIIRTGGELRTSGFMPLQSVYAEWYFTPFYFPDLTPKDLLAAICDFEKRERRFGGDSFVSKKNKGLALPKS